MRGRYAATRRPGVLAPAAVAGGSLLALGALLALLGKLTVLALRGLVYAALILTAAIVLGAGALAARRPRRRPHLYELLDPVGNCAVDRYDLYPAPPIEPYDVTGPIPPPAALLTQGPPTLVDDLLTPPTRQDPTVPLNLTDVTRPMVHPIGSARRLAAVGRLLDVRPSLEIDDAVVLIDAAATLIAQGDSTAARRLLAFGAPATVEELIEILDR